MTIEQMQDEIASWGWQWKEHVFNDGNTGNCMVDFTKDRSPHALSNHPYPADTVGWGRFARYSAWSMAYETLKKRAPKEVEFDPIHLGM